MNENEHEYAVRIIEQNHRECQEENFHLFEWLWSLWHAIFRWFR